MGHDDRPGFHTGLMIGAVAGFVLSMLIPSSAKERTSEAIESLAEKFQSLVPDEQEQERIRTIFKEKADTMQESYARIRDGLSDQLSKIRGGVSELDKSRYIKTLDAALERIGKEQEIPKRQLRQLRGYFMEDLEQLMHVDEI